MDSDSDLSARCIKCSHQKVDHDRNSSRDKMKCLIAIVTVRHSYPTGNTIG